MEDKPNLIFYCTFGSGQKGAPGYVQVYAPDELSAQRCMHKRYGDKWSMCYTSIEDVHSLDRTLRDILVYYGEGNEKPIQ